MSQKWIRSRKWDDEHIPRALRPLKALLRAFSSIPLAVVLLSLVAVYGTLASVPIGLIALIPTWVLYGASLVVVLGLATVVPMVLVLRGLRGVGVGGAGRFVIGLAGGAVLAAGTVWLWYKGVWPALRFDPRTGSGVRFFAEFVQANKSVMVRRLPILEMSELEFYAWWPLKLILGVFVVNMVVATVRRIEFTFVNLGVLTVHTGIVTLALGSIYYQALKEEGDMLLLAGQPDSSGKPAPGRPEAAFYDNTRVALWVSEDGGERWQQLPLEGVPRYNDYNLGALGLEGLGAGNEEYDRGRTLSLPLQQRGSANLPAMRIVGYAQYAELANRWVSARHLGWGGGEGRGGSGGGGIPIRQVALVQHGAGGADGPPAISLRPTQPAGRVIEMGGLLGIEYTPGMSAERWADLSSELPPGTRHALVVEVKGGEGAPPFRAVYPVENGTEIAVGDTGYRLLVRELMSRPPFPIITRGYEGARSSVAIVRVTPPEPKAWFDRWVYHRFPEIGQDMSSERNAQGMPLRRDMDPAIRIGYIDASISQVYLDEVAGGEGERKARALLRPAGGAARVVEDLATGSSVQIAPNASLRLGERCEDGVEVEIPMPVPPAERDGKLVGTHQRAAIALELSGATTGGEGWKRVVWVPFTQYIHISQELTRAVELPDGRTLRLAFGRLRRELPGLALQLVDFEMIPYPGSDVPRDYRSDLSILRLGGSVREMSHEVKPTSLNEPLLVRVPFRAREGVPWVASAIGRLVSVVAPVQYKFSQAGWDAEGWRETAAAAARGELPRAYARYTILGVGNNPGIYVIAAGAVMMSLGIPWAFYVKPLLVRRRKKRIQSELAARGDRNLAEAQRGGTEVSEGTEGVVSGR
jgi:hypothetical protein